MSKRTGVREVRRVTPEREIRLRGLPAVERPNGHL